MREFRLLWVLLLGFGVGATCTGGAQAQNGGSGARTVVYVDAGYFLKGSVVTARWIDGEYQATVDTSEITAQDCPTDVDGDGLLEFNDCCPPGFTAVGVALSGYGYGDPGNLVCLEDD